MLFMLSVFVYVVYVCLCCLCCLCLSRQTTCSTDLLSAEDLECKPKPLLKELRPVAANYHGLGIQLGISPAKIREFEAEASGQDVQRFLREVLDRWLGGDPQLGVLVDGLIEIGNRRLAEKVEVDYQGRFSSCKKMFVSTKTECETRGCDSS